jgi:hypothetical protein
MLELCGVVHLHTPYSDGSSSFDSYAKTAVSLGLDFCAITDHMSVESRKKEDIVKNGVHFLIGYEHNDERGINHCLVFGTDKVVDGSTPNEYLSEIRNSGGFSVLAHPNEIRNYFKEYPAYPWTNWELETFDGIELWNQFSVWVENLHSILSFVNILFPRRLTKSISPDLLARWDKINRTRFVCGVGGVDAHTLKQKFGPFTKEIFPLKVELSGVRQHLFIKEETTEGEERVEAIKVALFRGNGFISNFRRGDARGSKIELIDSKNLKFLPGVNDNSPTLPAKIEVSIPKEGRVRTIRNGEFFGEKVGCELSFDITQNGSYRVEVWHRGFGWIYSNHFLVGSYPFND